MSPFSSPYLQPLRYVDHLDAFSRNLFLKIAASRLVQVTQSDCPVAAAFSIVPWTSYLCKTLILYNIIILIVCLSTNALTIASALVLLTTLVFEGVPSCQICSDPAGLTTLHLSSLDGCYSLQTMEHPEE